MMQSRVGLNVHIYPSTFEYESRILKVTKTLVERTIVERVLVIATDKDGLPERQTIDDVREVLRVATRLNGERFWPKVFRFIEWSSRVFMKLRHETLDMVNCHSLSVLPLCVVLKWWHKCILVYEPHELETETATSRGIRKRIAKLVERRLVGQADRVIVVSDSIAEHYRRDYRLSKVPVILNVPEKQGGNPATPNSLLRDRFDIPDNHLVFMYQGVLEEVRGTGLLLDAFRQVAPDRHLVFMGFGSQEEEIRSVAITAPNVHFHPAVPPKEVMHYTQGADIGFALLSDDCLNNRCALPNKLFHYLHAGLPVIVSGFGEMSVLVNRFKCGWCVDNDTKSLTDCVSAIDLAALEYCRVGALSVKDELHWGDEADKLESIYYNLLSFGNTNKIG